MKRGAKFQWVMARSLQGLLRFALERSMLTSGCGVSGVSRVGHGLRLRPVRGDDRDRRAYQRDDDQSDDDLATLVPVQVAVLVERHPAAHAAHTTVTRR